MSYYDSEDQGHEYDDMVWLNPNPKRFWFADTLLYPAHLTERKSKLNMAEYTTEFVTGEIWWCKALGNPVDNYDGDVKEWTLDFVPDDTDFLKKHRLLDRS